MKWIIGILAVVGGLIAVVVVVGMSLPQNHTATRTARLSQPPDRVWEAVTNVAAYPTWRTGVTAVEPLPPHDDNIMWRETSGGDKLTFEAVTSERPSHFVARISDRGLPFGGSWDYRIAPDGAGSRLTITENGEVYNPVFRFVSRYVMGHTATIDRYLTDIAARLGDTYVPASG